MRADLYLIRCWLPMAPGNGEKASGLEGDFLQPSLSCVSLWDIC